jgi:hypothetical protein
MVYCSLRLDLFFKAALMDKHQAETKRIRVGQNWEPVLTEDKLKVELAKRAEAQLRATELENRVKALRARRLAK